MLPNIFLTAVLWGQCYYDPHVTDGNTEVESWSTLFTIQEVGKHHSHKWSWVCGLQSQSFHHAPTPVRPPQWEAASVLFSSSPLSELLLKGDLDVVLKSLHPLRLWTHEHLRTDSGITIPAKPERKEDYFCPPLAAITSLGSALACPGCHLATHFTCQFPWHHGFNISFVVR